MEHEAWPYAIAYYCFVQHAFEIKFERIGAHDATYKLKHGRRCKAQQIPFGALVHFRMPDPVLKRTPKFAARACPGIFTGYNSKPGVARSNNERGDSFVSPLEDWDRTETMGKKIRVFRVKEVDFDVNGVKCPIAEARYQRITTISELKNPKEIVEPKDRVTEGESPNMEAKHVPVRAAPHLEKIVDTNRGESDDEPPELQGESDDEFVATVDNERAAEAQDHNQPLHLQSMLNHWVKHGDDVPIGNVLMIFLLNYGHHYPSVSGARSTLSGFQTIPLQLTRRGMMPRLTSS